MPDKIVEIKGNDIDVKKIMDEIRQNIAKRNIEYYIIPELDETDLRNEWDETCQEKYREQMLNVNVLWSINTEKTITSHRKVLGKFIVLFKKILRKSLRWYINPIIDQQNHFNAEIVRTLNSLDSYMEYNNQKLALFESKFDKFKTHNEDLSNKIEKRESFCHEKHKDYDDHIQSMIEENNITAMQEVKMDIIDQIESNLKCQIETELKKQIERDINERILETITEERITNIERNLQSLNQVSTQHFNVEIANGDRLRRIERLMKKLSINNIDLSSVHIENLQTDEEEINNTQIDKTQVPKKFMEVLENSYASIGNEVSIDYFMFEQFYRGNREEIKSRHKQYIDLFENKEAILDIGCGRGEFLELMLEAGKKNVVGIDIDSDMISYCQDRDFPVKQVNALDYLVDVEDNSIDGVFMAQVVEHLKPDEIISLIRLVNKKLSPTGIFVIETINPQCLSIFANSFYMDMSHENPVHQFTLDFILKSEGFHSTSIRYSSKCDDNLVPIVSDAIANLDEVNHSIYRLNNLIYGYQDYAIIAVK